MYIVSLTVPSEVCEQNLLWHSKLNIPLISTNICMYVSLKTEVHHKKYSEKKICKYFNNI